MDMKKEQRRAVVFHFIVPLKTLFFLRGRVPGLAMANAGGVPMSKPPNWILPGASNLRW